eukprot:15749671-Heterocapsa_arctica.AAC.1
MAGRALSSDNAEMARTAMSSSSGANDVEQEHPERLTDEQMTMANSQTFQQTSDHAINSVANA